MPQVDAHITTDTSAALEVTPQPNVGSTNVHVLAYDVHGAYARMDIPVHVLGNVSPIFEFVSVETQ